MAQSYDITIQLTIKDVRVTEGHASKAQVAKALCAVMTEGMDLWGLNHGYAMADALRDDGVDAEAHFYGNVKCKVMNPTSRTSRGTSKPGKRAKNPGKRTSKNVRAIVRDAMK